MSENQSHSHIIQNYILIWLDSNINYSNPDFQRSITQLRRIITEINTFTDANECIDFLTDIKDEKVFMIMSDTFGDQLIRFIHDIPQLYSLYIFCDDKAKHELWTNNWVKLKGVFTQIEFLCDVLNRNTKQYDHESIPISIISSNDYVKQDLNELESSFMYSQILKEVLLDIDYNPTAKIKFVQFCRENYTDGSTLRVIDEFERDYDHHSAIRWYTRDCFIYSILNRALRLQEMDVLLIMGFFIRDLHQQIEQSYRQASEKVIVYRGQGLLNADFEKIRMKEGCLLSFNSFLSTSTDKQISFLYADSSKQNPELTGILFQISIDATVTSVPFAFVDTMSYFSSENEILFSMHTVFRIGRMDEIENRLWQVQLTLTSDDDEQLKILTERIRIEVTGLTSWDRLGHLMIRMGELDKAEEIYRTLFDSISETDKAQLFIFYHQLGCIKNMKGDFKEALSFFEKTIEILKKSIPADHSKLAMGYNSMGHVYCNMGDYSNALLFYQKALQIWEEILDSNHTYFAFIYNNIAVVYCHVGHYSNALLFYQKTLEISEKALPSNHPFRAQTYNNISVVYHNMGDYSNALKLLQKALVVREKYLPSNHPDLAETYNNIGKLHDTIGDYCNALFFHEKALEIRQKSLPSDHPDLAQTYNNIGHVHHIIGNYSNALSFYLKAFEIRKKTLPSKHLHLANSYNNIADMCRRVEDYANALLLFQKAVEIYETSLPPNHPSLAVVYNNIGFVHLDMRDYSNALSSCQKAADIQQKSLASNHILLGQTYNNIGIIYGHMEDYARALVFLERALEIAQQFLPDNHPNLQTIKQNITMLREKS